MRRTPDGDPEGPERPPWSTRPDASMSLLTDLMRGAGDDEYVEAARRRATAPGQDGAPPLGRATGRNVVAAGVLALVGVLLAAGALDSRVRAPAAAEERAQLAERVRAQTAVADALDARAAALQADVEALRDAGLGEDAQDAALADLLDRLDAVTGTAPASGPGVVVVLTDAQPAGPGERPAACEDGRVLDVDLQRLVNGLWGAGATGVAVGGQRLTAQTALRSAAGAVLVGYRPVASPYEVSALGDPAALEAGLSSGDTGAWFSTVQEECGIGYEARRSDDVRLPAATGPVVGDARTGARSGS